jgi:hypothetical protein
MTKPSIILTRSLKLYLTLLLISTGVILYGTLFPVDYKVPKSFIGYDKVVHLIMLGAWSFFYGIVRFLKGKYNLLPVFAVGAFFGLLIEILQYLLPTGRHPDAMDLVADITGTGLALLLLYILGKKIPGFKSERPS